MKKNKKQSQELFVQSLLSCKHWNYEYAQDLKSWSGAYYERGECEKCGRKGLRILHHLSHKYFKTKMIVGCNCASKMIRDSDTPLWQIRRLINRSERLKRWPELLWRKSQSGNFYLNKNKHRITVFRDKQNSGKYKICISREEEKPFFGPCSYDKLSDAKMAAFDLLEEKYDRGVIKRK